MEPEEAEYLDRLQKTPIEEEWEYSLKDIGLPDWAILIDSNKEVFFIREGFDPIPIVPSNLVFKDDQLTGLTPSGTFSMHVTSMQWGIIQTILEGKAH